MRKSEVPDHPARVAPRAAAPNPHALVAIQRQAGNQAVAGRMALAARQQARPVPVFLAPWVAEWRKAGLLDPPFRPADVDDFPDLPMPLTKNSPPSAARVGNPGVRIRPEGTKIDKVPREPVDPGPPRGRTVEPRPPRVEPEDLPGIVFAPGILGTSLLVALFTLLPLSTAPPWMDMVNPITGGPYGGQVEYEWLGGLTQPQRDYLRYLVAARQLEPDAAVDGAMSREDWPVTQQRTPGCTSESVPRRGGHARHDAYATKVTGTPSDEFVRTAPPPLQIYYDGRTPGTGTTWEVKTGYGWFFNPKHVGWTAFQLARWDTQKDLGLAVAARCGLHYQWAQPDRHIVQLLIARWGGKPPVLHIPE